VEGSSPDRWQTNPFLWRAFRPLAREARHNPTPAEDRLWQAVRRKQLCVAFHRQHSIGQFRVDFYCPRCRLVVELDGSSRDETAEYDAARTAYLKARNIRVLRFDNADVMRRLPAVMASIEAAIA
jgi:very-short-patch-repair endonuclease